MRVPVLRFTAFAEAHRGQERRGKKASDGGADQRFSGHNRLSCGIMRCGNSPIGRGAGISGQSGALDKPPPCPCRLAGSADFRMEKSAQRAINPRMEIIHYDRRTHRLLQSSRQTQRHHRRHRVFARNHLYPLLCVVQMASADEAAVVDTLAEGIDLKPFFDLMADEKVLKVFHAARQDIEIIWHRAGIVPHSRVRYAGGGHGPRLRRFHRLRSTRRAHHRPSPRQGPTVSPTGRTAR